MFLGQNNLYTYITAFENWICICAEKKVYNSISIWESVIPQKNYCDQITHLEENAKRDRIFLLNSLTLLLKELMYFKREQSFSKWPSILGASVFWDNEMEPHFQKELSSTSLKSGLFQLSQIGDFKIHNQHFFLETCPKLYHWHRQ